MSGQTVRSYSAGAYRLEKQDRLRMTERHTGTPWRMLTFKLSFEGSDKPLLLSEPVCKNPGGLWGPSKPPCYMKEKGAARVTGSTSGLFCEFYCIVLWCEPAPEGRDGSRVWVAMV